jgi:hypothetical protein
MEVLSTPAGRVKASACALPLSRLAALTRPTAADLGQPSDLRFGMSMLLINVAPRSFVAQHGIENGQQLARHRDDRDEFRLASGNQPLPEGLEHRIGARRDESAHEQSRPHARSAAADEALAFPSAGLPRPWGKAGERRDLFAAERTELRQLRDERSRDHRPDARHRGEQVFLLAPGRRAAHRIVDVLVERGEFLCSAAAAAGVSGRNEPQGAKDGSSERGKTVRRIRREGRR